jgi:hypothetical protein
MAKYNPVKKKNVEENANIKTMSDYALILHHCNGYSRIDSMKKASESEGEPLFEELLKRNIELFTTGSIVLSIGLNKDIVT